MISKNIRKIRRKLGLTQQQLAFILDASQQAVANYENGVRKPSIEFSCKLIKFAQERGLKVHLEDILCKDWGMD